jgi:hypothetical protein
MQNILKKGTTKQTDRQTDTHKPRQWVQGQMIIGCRTEVVRDGCGERGGQEA